MGGKTLGIHQCINISHIHSFSSGIFEEKRTSEKVPFVDTEPRPPTAFPAPPGPADAHLHHGDVEAVHRAQRPSILQLLGRLRVQLHLLLLLRGRDAEEVVWEFADVHLRGEAMLARPGHAGQARTPATFRTQVSGCTGPQFLHLYSKKSLRSAIQPGDPKHHLTHDHQATCLPLKEPAPQRTLGHTPAL